MHVLLLFLQQCTARQGVPGPADYRAGLWVLRRHHIEKINAPFLYKDRGTPADYSAGLRLAIERGWLVMHESGTFVKFTQAGADLFA
jgi:hypothetical protein